MSGFPAALDNLINAFASLPGVGRKSAQRMAFYVLSLPEGEANRLAGAITGAAGSIRTCPVCENLTDTELCPVCANAKRDSTTVCVVAEPKDVLSFERSREYTGVYHVLHGTLSPLAGVGPDDLRIKSLIGRISGGGVREVIMATNPDAEGDTTAMYIARLIAPFGVKVTRLAFGLPVGSNLEFADDATLLRALEGRREL